MVGSRFPGIGDYQAAFGAGSRCACWPPCSRGLAGTKLTDVTSGFRAAGPRCIELFALHYPADTSATRSSPRDRGAHRLHVDQMPVEMRVRAHGKPSQSSFRPRSTSPGQSPPEPCPRASVARPEDIGEAQLARVAGRRVVKADSAGSVAIPDHLVVGSTGRRRRSTSGEVVVLWVVVAPMTLIAAAFPEMISWLSTGLLSRSRPTCCSSWRACCCSGSAWITVMSWAGWRSAPAHWPRKLLCCESASSRSAAPPRARALHPTTQPGWDTRSPLSLGERPRPARMDGETPGTTSPTAGATTREAPVRTGRREAGTKSTSTAATGVLAQSTRMREVRPSLQGGRAERM